MKQDESKLKKQMNRRTFSKLLGLPLVVSPQILGWNHATAAGDRIGLGVIGLGTMGKGHLYDEAWTYMKGGYVNREDVQVLGVCDVWKNKREENQDRINQHYSNIKRKDSKDCQAYRDFRELLANDDIDAVLITSPIHWHATMAVMAARAGKDIYCEKPTGVTIHESRQMQKAVKENNVIYQAGTQQRSEYEDRFRIAAEYIRSGRIGEVKEVYAFCPGGGAVWDQPAGEKKPIPEDLDWDLWLGPAPERQYEGRWDAHFYGFGGINWGQHHYDIVQWSLGMDGNGPVEIWVEEGAAVYRYENGIVVYARPYPGTQISETGGAWFIGTEGKIAVDREHLLSEPESILNTPLKNEDVHLFKSPGHSVNFIECMRSRKKTVCNEDIAHRSVSVLLLGGIAQRLDRKLQWDPVKEIFIGDDEANAMLDLPKRAPWVL
jgi:predicted dehydrogenase